MNAPPLSPRPASSLVLPGLGLALALALTLPPLSSTRIFTWPWALGAAAAD